MVPGAGATWFAATASAARRARRGFAGVEFERDRSRGVVDDVVDLRRDSLTCRRGIAATLTADNGEALLIPAGCAHGFLTLEDATDVLYQIDRAYAPGHARGLRYDDAAIGIAWPAAPRVIAPADLAWPAFGGVESS